MGSAAEATPKSCPRVLSAPVASETDSGVDSEDSTAAGLVAAAAEVVVVASEATLVGRATGVALDHQAAHRPAQGLIDAMATAVFRGPATIREDRDALTTDPEAIAATVADLGNAMEVAARAATWNRSAVVTVGFVTATETATAIGTEKGTETGTEVVIVATTIGREMMTTGSEPTRVGDTTIPGRCRDINHAQTRAAQQPP